MPTLECPTCRKQIKYADLKEVPYRPFCSRRCKLVDLGRWLNEEFRVSEELPPELRSGPGSNDLEGD
jgi:endogenous inhibitor of DNA gyrase (YacG/DUF329 family)